jgi:uncharacterized protein (TIGR03437 family)
MKLAKVLLVLTAALAWQAAAQTTPAWDTSGNGMLNGTYYFRQAYYVLSGEYDNGELEDAAVTYGNITFSGAGTYSMSVTFLDAEEGGQRGTLTGTYSIGASGYGFLSNPITGDVIYGLVNQQGIFVGSDTETENGYNDMLVAVPVGSTQASASTFKGTYSVAFIDLSSFNPETAFGGMLQMTADGAGNIGTVTVNAYVGEYGSQAYPQTLTGVKYIFSSGAGVATFPSSSTALVEGQQYFYISPDGNFFVGGSPESFNMMVGVRTGSGTPALNGLYYQAGIDADESQLASGYGDLDTYYGAFKASGGNIVAHQRLLDWLSIGNPIDYTYSDSYTNPLPASGVYNNGVMNFVVGESGIRIGAGIGPYLGINVAIPQSTFSGSGVFLDPTGIVNAASSAPFTAGIAPGELLTMYGTNLASSLVVASQIPFPTSLGGVQVTVNGLPAPIYYVSPTQISAIVPYAALTSGIAAVQVTNNSVPSDTVTMFTSTTAPGVFTVPPGGLGYGAVLHQDGVTLVTAQDPAQIGETVSVFVTGLGTVSPPIGDGAAGPSNPLSYTSNTISADISGTTATVTYAGLAPGLAGLYQVNVTIPTGLTTGNNNLDLAGPDSYASEVVIPIGTAGTVSSPSALPARAKAKPKVTRTAVSPAARRRSGEEPFLKQLPQPWPAWLSKVR